VNLATKRKTTRQDRFVLRYFILCDDARREANGKLLLVGVYNDDVLITSESQEFPRLSFVFSISRLTDELPSVGTFRLQGPDGVLLPQTKFQVHQGLPEFKATNLLIHASGLSLSSGAYQAILSINGSSELVGEFLVRHDPELLKRVVLASAFPAEPVSS